MKKNQGKLIALFAPGVEEGKIEEPKLDDYELVKLLGAGAFGEVSKAKSKKTGQFFALKQIKKDAIRNYQIIDQVKREIQLMYQMQHEHIIKLHAHFEDEEHVNLLMEFVSGGSIFERIKQNGRLTEKEIVRYMRQILSAINYLHNQPQAIIHRDIKPENILLDEKNNVKLADFGSANSINKDLKEKRSTYTGTKIFMAPEIFESVGYDETVDIWSLGVFIYELISGESPFLPIEQKDLSSREQEMIIVENIKKVQIYFTQDFPPLARDLVRKMLKKGSFKNNLIQQIDPAQRITIKEILEHPWMKQEIEIDIIPSEQMTRQLQIEKSLKKFKNKKNDQSYLTEKQKFDEVKNNIIQLKSEINKYEIDIQKLKLENDDLKSKLEEIEKANKAAEEQPLEDIDELDQISMDSSQVIPAISPARIVKVEHQFNKLNQKIIQMQRDIIQNETEIAKNQYKLDKLSSLEEKVKREKKTVERLEKELLSLDEQKKQEYQKLEEIFHAFTALNKERSISLKKYDQENDENTKYIPLLKAIVEKLKSIINLHRDMINNPQSFSIDDKFSDDEDDLNSESFEQLDRKLNEMQKEYESRKQKMKSELKKEMKSLQILEEENQKLKQEVRLINEKEQLIEKAENIIKNLDFSHQIKEEQIKDLKQQKEENQTRLNQLQDKFTEEKEREKNIKMP